ncbi:relaxin-3 [Amia ocellicauda]|uniref:relaxin-3-like n=1 Tax=Amia ocellicauda TaxID=2972642 RepID=UPI00346423ED
MSRPLLLLCVLGLALGGALGSERPPPSYGVKLCGREFIRAVIFTCGGSRWRRTTRGSADLSLDSFSPDVPEASDSWSPDSIPGLPYAELPELEAPGWTGRAAAGAGAGGAGLGFERPSRSALSEEVLQVLRSADRKGRDVVVGLSNACCKWGCSKSEISSLC